MSNQNKLAWPKSRSSPQADKFTSRSRGKSRGVLDQNKKWEIVGKCKPPSRTKVKGVENRKSELETIIDVLLKNRGIKTKGQKREFFKPIPPNKLSLKSLGIRQSEVNKAIRRLNTAKKKRDQIIVYGDYDADGICATAILWECLYKLGFKVIPYIPDRFSEGYGVNPKTIQELKVQNSNLGLLITVDNGIVARDAIDTANKLGVDVIVTDHHRKGKKLPEALAIIHTDKINGAGVAWILAREIYKKYEMRSAKRIVAQTRRPTRQSYRDVQYEVENGLELTAIGTVADQSPLIGPNRSFVKYGLDALNKTRRIGLLTLFKEAGLSKGNLGTYELGFIIAPRINAMGRLEHAMDSLRLLCTKDRKRAQELAYRLGKINTERQKIVDEVVLHVRERALKKKWKGVIVLSHESYHEGVIGLAAAKLVEEFYRPAIVISQKGEYSKASARSISGFNIINVIRQLDHLTEEGGGHPMAAGFTIETNKIELFFQEMEKISTPLLTEEVLSKRLKVDLELKFDQINQKLIKRLSDFEPNGIGNPRPTFVTNGVSILEARVVGREGKHLKVKLEKNGKVFEAIGFGFGDYYIKVISPGFFDVAYNIEENEWGGQRCLELKIRDIKESSAA